jgi:hypothetical protein
MDYGRPAAQHGVDITPAIADVPELTPDHVRAFGAKHGREESGGSSDNPDPLLHDMDLAGGEQGDSPGTHLPCARLCPVRTRPFDARSFQKS